MIIAATGHRPEKLGGYGQDARHRLIRFARHYLLTSRPSKVISGMALGWDQAFAHAAAMVGVPFTAAVPFEGQERFWPEDSQRRYKGLLDRAEEVVFVCGKQGPFKKSFLDRNKWMVDRADRIAALWNGSWGGTGHCVEYADSKGVPIDQLWSRFGRYGEVLELVG